MAEAWLRGVLCSLLLVGAVAAAVALLLWQRRREQEAPWAAMLVWPHPPIVATYINLAPRVDRRTQVEAEFSGIPNLTLQRLEASSGERDGWIGCLASHVRALEAAYARDDPFALVLEDDAQWNPALAAAGRLQQQLDAAMDATPQWDVFMLSHTFRQWAAGAPPAAGTPARLAFAYSGAAYIVRRAYIPQMLAVLQPSLAHARTQETEWSEMAVDLLFAEQLMPRGQWWAFATPTITQRPSFSDIVGADVDYTQLARRQQVLAARRGLKGLRAF